MYRVTGPVTQKLQGPSTVKDFRNYECSYRVLVPELFSTTLNDCKFFPPHFNPACQPGISIGLRGLVLQGSPHRQGELADLAPQTSTLFFCWTRCGTRKSAPGAVLHSAPSPATPKGF